MNSEKNSNKNTEKASEKSKTTRPISVSKFGGTSVKSIGRIQHVAEIIANRAKSGPQLVVVSAMGDTTDYLVKLANQCLANPGADKPDARELDQLLASGEQISITLVTMVLHALGIKAKSFLAHQVGIFTESVHNKARIVNLETSNLLKAFTENEVVVVAGFQGVTPEGDITTLGRGAPIPQPLRSLRQLVLKTAIFTRMWTASTQPILI
jgi:aspartate kinase